MNYAVVTSCSAAGWTQYGARFVETFLKFWPEGIELILCSEDDLRQQTAKHASASNFTVLDLNATAGKFIARHAKDAVAHGRKIAPGQKAWKQTCIANGYNFRFDAARFGLKVFAIDMAARRRTGRLFWVDADVVTFAPVPRTLLEDTLPPAFALSCLDRGTDYHSDCSWVGYNLEHPDARPFISAFRSLYETDAVMKLREWHDSWVFDWLRRERRVSTHCIPHTSRSHPLPNSVIGTVADHLKGERKKLGRTPPSELTQRHAHAYWKAA